MTLYQRQCHRRQVRRPLYRRGQSFLFKKLKYVLKTVPENKGELRVGLDATKILWTSYRLRLISIEKGVAKNRVLLHAGSLD